MNKSTIFRSKILIILSLFFNQFIYSQELDSNKIDMKYKYAEELKSNYKLDSAIIIYNQIYKSDSTQILALKSLEKLYSQTIQYREAYNCANKLKELENDNQYYKIRCGLLLKKLGESDSALCIFKPVIYSDTTNSFILTQIADIYYDNNNVDSAMLYFNKSCIIKPTPTNLIKGTELLLKNKQKEQALSFIKTYYKPSPESNKLLNQVYGKTHYLNDSIYDAYNTFNELRKGGDSSLITTKFLGLCCWKASYFHKGKNYLEEYTKRDSTDYMSYYVLSICCRNCSEFKKSIDYMNKSLSLYKLDSNTLNMMYQGIAESYFGANDYNNSIYYFEKLIETDPRNIYGEYRIAMIYDYSLKEKDKAINYYNDIIKRIDESGSKNHDQIKIFCETRIDQLNESAFWSQKKSESDN